jgi:GTP-binding protein
LDSTAPRLPRIAIVGRPNVGKSTLTNRMCGSLVSIVEPTAGVTRDRVAVPARLRGRRRRRWVEVVDTGGIGIVDRDDLGPLVERQIEYAIATADLILWLVDSKEGVTPLDELVARRLRGIRKPVVLVANKTEGRDAAWAVGEFHKLGASNEPLAISAQNGEGVEELYDEILAHFDEEGDEASDEVPPVKTMMRLAVVGQRNAGKSSFINALAQEERMIVSEVPGTTRDSVDVVFERDGQSFVAIDTAGVRRRKSLQDAIEFYADSRSHRSIRRADVVVLLFDVTRKLSSIDKDLARYAIDHHKPTILGANKWDLVADLSPEDFREYIDDQLPSLDFAPVSFLSAKTGKGVDGTMRLALELFEQAQLRISTGELNRVLQRALSARPPSAGGHAARVRYATQADTRPPTFVLFVNDKKNFNKDYIRYLENRLREEFPFKEIPVRIVLKDREMTEAEKAEEQA